MTFVEWLKLRHDDLTPIGQLSRDWFDDPNRPCGEVTFQMVQRHLENNSASECAMSALRQAWKEFGEDFVRRCGRKVPD